jgi:putative SOS response-associated peptidase YedK
MPVMLPRSAWGVWLDPGIRDSEEIRQLVERIPTPDLAQHPVSTLVNRVTNDAPELTAPLESGIG